MFSGLREKLAAKKQAAATVATDAPPSSSSPASESGNPAAPTPTPTATTTTTSSRDALGLPASAPPKEAQQEGLGKKRSREDTSVEDDARKASSSGSSVEERPVATVPPPVVKIVDAVIPDLPYLEEKLWTHEELREYTKGFLIKITENLKTNAAKAGKAGCPGKSPVCIVPLGILSKMFTNDLPVSLEKVLYEGTEIFSNSVAGTTGLTAAETKFMEMHVPRTENGAPAHAPHEEAVPRELRVKVETMNALWHLNAFHLRETIRQKWSYDVYLARHHALGEEARINRGSVIAAARDVIADLWSSHTSIMMFIVLLLQDCVAHYEAGADSAEERKQKDAGTLPTEVVEGIRRMMRYTQKKRYAECKQQYVDMTMGVSNWCLGLFSGGEMHMRRSLEKIERGRIIHVLKNDNAIAILHAVREVANYVERNESAFALLGHFAFISSDAKE